MLKAAGRDATRRNESADRGGKKRSGRIKCGKVFVGGDILCFWRESLLLWRLSLFHHNQGRDLEAASQLRWSSLFSSEVKPLATPSLLI